MNADYTYLYESAFDRAVTMMLVAVDLEPTSALKQATSDCGIPFGEEMGKFVEWAVSHFD